MIDSWFWRIWTATLGRMTQANFCWPVGKKSCKMDKENIWSGENLCGMNAQVSKPLLGGKKYWRISRNKGRLISVPAAAVIQIARVLFRLIGRKRCVGCNYEFYRKCYGYNHRLRFLNCFTWVTEEESWISWGRGWILRNLEEVQRRKHFCWAVTDTETRKEVKQIGVDIQVVFPVNNGN